MSAESMQCAYDSKGNSVPTILLLMQDKLYSQGGLKVVTKLGSTFFALFGIHTSPSKNNKDSLFSTFYSLFVIAGVWDHAGTLTSALAVLVGTWNSLHCKLSDTYKWRVPVPCASIVFLV